MFVQVAGSALLTVALLAGVMWAWRVSGWRPWRTRSRYGLEAQAALWRHPAGRGRWPGPGDSVSPGADATHATRPVGPDDDPDFLRTLERMIRGDDQGTGS